jgi:hypothetical protein
MKPTDFAQTLIELKMITDLQWNLYHLASRYLEAERVHAFTVLLRFKSFEIQAHSVAYDVDMPGLLRIEGTGEAITYADWSDLVSVKIPKN